MLLGCAMLVPVLVSAPVSAFERRTHCLGRYLLDLPVDSRVEAEFAFADAKIETIRAVDEAGYRQRVEARERELRISPHGRGGSQFVGREDFDPQHVSLASWNGPSSRRVYRYDMYAYRPERGVLFELAGRGLADEQTQATAFEYQRDLLTRSIRYRASDEIPRDPGFCIDSGFIARSALNKEEVKMEATLPAHPGVTVSFLSYVTGRPDAPLLDRTSSIPRGDEEVAARMKTVRRGARRVGHAQGQELLVRGDADGKTDYEFLWEFQGEANSLAFPFLALRLSTALRSDDRGEVLDAPFASDEDAVAFWDSLLPTLRIRPGAVGR